MAQKDYSINLVQTMAIFESSVQDKQTWIKTRCFTGKWSALIEKNKRLRLNEKKLFKGLNV